ncbi:MAG: DUF4097 family beta strand repeat protein [Oscillospiraceae bacterium]|nr:DUF4097 family beta strand repeat protein [Oscillospiraceae bacterium]
MKKTCLRLLISGAIFTVIGIAVLSAEYMNGLIDEIPSLSIPVHHSYAAGEAVAIDNGEYAETTFATTYIMGETSYIDDGYYDNIIKIDASPEDINNLDININMGLFNILPADSFMIGANNAEPDWIKCSVDGDRLSVSFEPEFEFKLIDLNFGNDSAEIYLYVPQRVYETVKIDVDAGTANISGISANNFEFDMSAGDAYVSETSVFYNSDIKMSAGYTQFTGCTLLNSSSIKVSAGSMVFDECSVTGVNDIKVSAGSLDMHLLDDFSFYSISAERSAGEVIINGEPAAKEFKAYPALSEPLGTINVKVSAGSCYINFEED